MPPTVLQQLHTVVLGPGASTTIAHSLTDGNRLLLPNDIMPDRDTPIRVTAATTVDVTYENTDGANAQTAVFRVQFDHTIQQATPTQGNPQLNRYYQGGGSGGGGLSSASNCLIFQPGGAQTGPVVFNDWGDLVTQLGVLRAAANSDGCYTIVFDDRFGSPAVIPAGVYDMTGVTWSGRPPGGSASGTPVVQPADGALFTRLRKFEGNLWVEFAGSTPPISDIGNDDVVTIRDNVVILVTGGTEPFFEAGLLNVDRRCVFVMDEIVLIGDGTNPVIFGDLGIPNENDAVIFLDLGSDVEIAADALETGLAFRFDGKYRNGSARVLTQASATIGTFDTTTHERWDSRTTTTGNTILNPTDEDFGALFRCDPDTGDITINLPPVTDLNRGQPFTVKRVDTGAANNVNVTPAGADQIDSGGAGTPFVNSTPLSSNTFISNGTGGWDVI